MILVNAGASVTGVTNATLVNTYSQREISNSGDYATQYIHVYKANAEKCVISFNSNYHGISYMVVRGSSGIKEAAFDLFVNGSGTQTLTNVKKGDLLIHIAGVRTVTFNNSDELFVQSAHFSEHASGNLPINIRLINADSGVSFSSGFSYFADGYIVF